eukprot:SAG22_NODE_3352_length_1762_cov_4.031870_1_plen_117_part_00
MAARQVGQRLGLLSDAEAQAVEFRLADAVDPAQFGDATHVYAANLCFPPDLNKRLALALQLVPSLQCAITLARLPDEDGVAANGGGERNGLELVATRRVPASWNPRATAYYYCRRQ